MVPDNRCPKYFPDPENCSAKRFFRACLSPADDYGKKKGDLAGELTVAGGGARFRRRSSVTGEEKAEKEDEDGGGGLFR